MGFPFDEATWNAVTGAMFAGWGTSAPGFYTFIGLVACAVILWLGNKNEKSYYNKHDNMSKQEDKGA